MKKYLIICTSLAAIAMFLSGCVATSSYYTARTLKPGKFSLAFGADDILMKESKTSTANVGISKNLPFAPSLGIAFGLPLRLEAGFRWYPLSFFEGTLREQVNPRTFTIFDGSVDVSYAGLLGEYSYLKYGVTFSKDIHGFEPYIHYYFYNATGKMKSSTDERTLDGFITNLSKQVINNSRTIGFGIGIPFHKVKFFPSFDYQYYDNNLSMGIWQFGIGIRIYTN